MPCSSLCSALFLSLSVNGSLSTQIGGSPISISGSNLGLCWIWVCVAGGFDCGFVGGNLDGLFESQGNEAREEEGAKGVDLEGNEVFGDGGAGGAID